MTTYYVDINGSNSNSGTASTAPWASIQKALNVLVAGDTLNIMAGTYNPGDDTEGNGDYWYLKNKNGESGNVITIQNNSSDTVVLDGQESGEDSGYPRQGLRLPKESKRIKYGGITYKLTDQALFELKDCSYVTIDGIQVKNSLGHGLNLLGTQRNNFAGKHVGHASEGTKPSVNHHIIVTNCKIHNTRHRNMKITNAWDITIGTYGNGNQFSFGSWAQQGGSGGPNVSNGYYIKFDYNVVFEQAGEPFVVDANNFYSRNIYVRNNIIYDCEDPLLFHGVSYFIVAGNYIYFTDQEKAAPKGFVQRGGKGLVIKTTECNKDVQRPCEYGLIAHNVIVNAKEGLMIKNDLPRNNSPTDSCGKKYHAPAHNYIYVVNNTVVNSEVVNYLMNNYTAANCVFKNNVSVNTAAGLHIGTKSHGNAKFSGWDADYNLYYSGTPSQVANLNGASDQDNVDPALVDESAPDKGAVTLQTDAAGYYANFSLKSGYDNATGFRIPGSAGAYQNGLALTAPAGWNSDADGDDMSDWISKAFDFGLTGTNPTRSDPPDIGAHEYGADGEAGPPTAAATVDDATITIGTASGFGATGGGGTGALTYAWDFGDNKGSSAVEDPSYTYTDLGYFIATLTVTDSKGLSATDTVAVAVSADVGGTDTTVATEQVMGTAGSNFTVSKTPKALFFAGTLATTDDTAINNTLMMYGIWGDNDGGTSYGASLFATHGVNTTAIRSSNVDNGVLHFLEDVGNNSKVATVTSVSASTVTMAWPDNENSEKVSVYAFYGDNITNVKACEVALGGLNDTTTISGDYNYMIMPSSLLAGFGDSYSKGALTLAMAAKDVGQVSHTTQNRDNQATTDIRAYTSDTRVSYIPSSGEYVEIDSWDSAGITFVAKGGAINSSIPVLLMKITGADIKLGSFSTPTATGNKDYTTAAIDGQQVFVWGGQANAINTYLNDDTAGVFNFHSADDTNNYTLAISSDDALGSSDESSYYADAYEPRDYDGASGASGALSIITNGFRIAPTSADSTAYTQVYCLIEETAAPTTLAANFIYYKSGTNPADNVEIKAGDSVQFLNTSGSDYAITEADTVWTWGDGTANTTADDDPTHTFNTAGTFSVELDTTDANSANDTITIDVVAYNAPPTNAFDPATDITPAIGYGALPLSCEIDASGISAGTGETIEEIQLHIVRNHADDSEQGDLIDIRPESPLVLPGQPGDTYEFVLSKAGVYDLNIWVYQEGRDEPWIYPYFDAWTVTAVDDTVVKITSDYGRHRVPRGAFTITYTLEDNFGPIVDDSTYASILWNPGDGTGTDTAWEFAHEYQVVATPTAYTVSCTLTGHGAGETYAATETDYITIYPASTATAPISLTRLHTRLTNLLAVDYLDGTWTQQSAPNTSVYLQANSMPWADATERVIEDGVELTSKASIALCQATPGTYYMTTDGTILSVYVHPLGSTAPTGKTFRWLY